MIASIGRPYKTLLAAIIILIAAVLVVLPQRYRNGFESVRMSGVGWFSPIQGLAARLEGGVAGLARRLTGMWSASGERQRLLDENAELKQRLDTLQAQLLREKRSARGIEALRDYTDSANAETVTFIPAAVIGEDPAGIPGAIVINRGATDGVHSGLGVIWGRAVVGVVARSSASASMVWTLSHPSCRVPAYLAGSGHKGLVRGLSERKRITLLDHRFEKSVRRVAVKLDADLCPQLVG